MRAALTTAFAVLAGTVGLTLAPPPALAAAPAPVPVTASADRSFGNGGPAVSAPLNALFLAAAADGSTLLFDLLTHQVRRVDASTGTITAVAGAPAGSVSCPLSTTADPLSVPLGEVSGLWATDDGSTLVQTCGQLMRLDPVDHHWHVALASAPSAVAVRPNGDIVVHTNGGSLGTSTLRSIPAGSAPDAPGTVIASDVYVDRLALGADGTPYVSTSGRISRVNADGSVTPIAGTGQPPSSLLPDDGAGQTGTSVPVMVDGLTVSPDGGTVFFRDRQGLRSLLRAVPSSGGLLRTVAGPQATCYTQGCLTNTLLAHGTDLLSGATDIRAYPADGSSPGTGTPVAGLATGESPDGVTVAHAFLNGARAVAALPGGGIAVATYQAVRTLTSPADDGVLGTRAAGLVADSLSAAPDGTLYAGLSTPNGAVVDRISATGEVTQVLGGGASALLDGANALDVHLATVKHAVDADGTLLFAADAHLYAVVGGAVHIVAALPTAPTGLVAGPAHQVTVAYTAGDPSLMDLDTSSTPAVGTVVSCRAGCPTTELLRLANGGLVGSAAAGLVVRAPDGTVQVLPSALGGVTAALGNRVLALPRFATMTGGLLATSADLALPSYADGPSTAFTAGTGRVTVTVTPKPGVVQRVQVIGNNLAGLPITVLDATTDGSGAQLSATVVHLAAEGLLGGHAYSFTTVASEGTITAVTDRTDVTPLADTTAPGPAGLSVASYFGQSSLTVSPPADDDVPYVVVRKSDTGEALTGPTSGVAVGSAYPGYPPLQTTVDPLRTTQFAAFAVDYSGNVSQVTTAVRPAAGLVAGAAVGDVGYRSVGGTSQLTWHETDDLAIRYAAGTVAPVSPLDGTPLQHLSGGEGTTTYLPLATGAKAAVSVFAYDSTGTGFRRTSFVVTGGASSDSLTITTTPTVNPGTRPSVIVKLIRSTTLGTHGLAGQQVTLYRRAVGASAWTVVSGQTTTATGTLSFVVPAVVGATDYQARVNAFDGASVVATRRTTVRQLVTAALSVTSVRRGSPVYVRGALNPRHSARVSLQKYVSGRWVTVASATASSTGAYAVRWVPTTAGSSTLRIASPATTAVLAGFSPNRVLRVT